MKIKISKNLEIGDKRRPIIVAEISGNHKGQKSKFLKLIKSAVINGADMVKIQTYSPEDITMNKKEPKFMIKDGIWKKKYLWDLYKKAHTPYSWHKDAFQLAKKLKTILFSSPFSKKSVDFLEKLNVKLYKLASFELTDLSLIDYIARKKPIIISIGMASFKEIDRALRQIEKYHKKIIILFCVSGYPTKLEDANVNTINKLKKKYKNYLIGLSDHTNDITSSVAATSLGACLIEKHFNLSKKIKLLTANFQFYHQLKELRKVSENIFLSLGKEFVGPKKAEKNSLRLRRSLFAIKDIKKGDKFSEKNIRAFRPKIGLGAENYFSLIGKKSKKFFKKGSPIY